MKKDNRCVHTEHCCVLHGCKYSDEDCPVELELKKQSHTCEDCYEHGVKTLEDLELHRGVKHLNEEEREIAINLGLNTINKNLEAEPDSEYYMNLKNYLILLPKFSGRY